MPLSDRVTIETCRIAMLLLFSASAAAHVDTFSYPAFNASTTWEFVVASNASVLEPASLLFDHGDDAALSASNRTEGFLLLSQTIDVWRAGPGGAPAAEASFNTSFTLSGGAAVAFVLLRDSFPPLYGQGGLRGFANYTSPDDGVSTAAVGGLANVEVGPVRSYGPDDPAVGLNVTVTPNAMAAASTRTAVWVEYAAAAHRLSVRVAGAGDPRPSKALLDAPLELVGRATSENALVGFFAAAIQEIVVSVRDWDLAVESLEGDGKKKKSTSWWVILLAVLGSVAAAAAIVAAVVCCFQSRRRRRQLNMQPPKI